MAFMCIGYRLFPLLLCYALFCTNASCYLITPDAFFFATDLITYLLA